MAWEKALDRLLLEQIHAAEKAERRPETVREQLLHLSELSPGRPQTAFFLGYARTVLGLDLPDPPEDPACRRWHLFGRLRGHDRRGERSWIADLVQDPAVFADLLGDPEIAPNVLPVLVRTLFWCGDLRQAVRAVEYMATSASADLQVIVDAALTDLLARLENRSDPAGQESTEAILADVMRIPRFASLPPDVRARYHKAAGARLLASSEWDAAREQLEAGLELCLEHPRLASAISALLALAEMRCHDVIAVEPRAVRPERQRALDRLAPKSSRPEHEVPEAAFLRALLAYEVGDWATAAPLFEKAVVGMRRLGGRDLPLLDRSCFYLAAALLASGVPEESSRALKLMEQALCTVHPDLESFYTVHDALKRLDRKLALRFLDAVEIGRGTSADQLLFVALEYLSLAEADPALKAAQRVLEIATSLDQRIEALRVVLTAQNMKGACEHARATFAEMRDLLLQRGEFESLEKLLKNEDSVGQALDHVEIKVELASLYEEMEGRDFDRAQLQIAIARSLRARKEADCLRQAHELLREVSCSFPELAADDLAAVEKLLALQDEKPADRDRTMAAVRALAKNLGRKPKVLVVGGNERQRRHHGKLEALAREWDFESEWLMANYTSPQKVVSAVADHLRAGIDCLLMLHWNRHEATEPALELARKAEVAARTVHYVGFTSLRLALAEAFEQLADSGRKSVRA
ncbi:MAG: hypothetical protein Fur0037_25890 [Planctomycetota bacterium]